MLTTRKRIALLTAGAVVALALSAGAALAVFPTDSVTHFTGCLNTSASPGGTFVNVAQGESPSRACGKGQVVAHLSGGDITNVQTASGSGLTGGTDNGAASLALDATGCSNGGVLKWNGTGWSCGSDNNTSYSAGTGLDLNGSTFSVNSGYQLPQNCGNGQVPKSNGSGSWSCQNDDTGTGTGGYSASSGYVTVAGTTTIISKSLPAGEYVLFARVNLLNSSFPDGSAQGYCAIPGDSEGGGSTYNDHFIPSDETTAADALTSAISHPGGAVALTRTEEFGNLDVASASLTAIKVDALG